MALCGSAFLSAAVTRVRLQEALIKVHFIKISFGLVLLVPAQFEHGVKVEELGRYLEAYSAGIVGALLHFLFLGCFNGDNLKIIQRRGREGRSLNICELRVAFCHGSLAGAALERRVMKNMLSIFCSVVLICC